MRRVPLVIAAAAALLVVGGAAAQQVDASWVDSERASATFAATTMQPPAQLRCVQSGLLQPVVLAWDPPTSGAPVTGYRYTLGSGAPVVLPASQTTVTLSGGLLALGSSTFSLYALGPGTWESSPVTATVTRTTVIVNLSTSCSVP